MSFLILINYKLTRIHSTSYDLLNDKELRQNTRLMYIYIYYFYYHFNEACNYFSVNDETNSTATRHLIPKIEIVFHGSLLFGVTRFMQRLYWSEIQASCAHYFFFISIPVCELVTVTLEIGVIPVLVLKKLSQKVAISTFTLHGALIKSSRPYINMVKLFPFKFTSCFHIIVRISLQLIYGFLYKFSSILTTLDHSLSSWITVNDYTLGVI